MAGHRKLTESARKALKTKPNLNLKPNHYKTELFPNRVYDSKLYGQACRDKKGWYKKEK